MDHIERRVIDCFQTVFPALPESQIRAASVATVESWDSIAAVTLGNVIEEEFGIPMDFDRLAEFDSFDRVLEWVREELPRRAV